VWERGQLLKGGETLPWELGRKPSRNRGRACPFSPGPLCTAMYFLTGSAVMFSKYCTSRLLRHLRRLDDANSFLMCEHTLASSYGD
jgi:hypothetical protein